MQGIRPGWRRMRAKTSEEDVTEEDDDGKGSSRTDVEWYEGSPPPFLNKAKRGKKRSQDWTESGRQMAVYGVTVHVYRVMRFYGCYWISLRILRMLLAIFFLLVIYSEAVYIYCSGLFYICCYMCFSQILLVCTISLYLVSL